jgi:hypothetical protein
MDMNEISARELRAMQGAWRAVRASWDLSDREVRDLLPQGGESISSPPHDTELRMRLMIEISYRLPSGIDDRGEWLRMPTERLGWLSPLDVMASDIRDLRVMRRMLEAGQL